MAASREVGVDQHPAEAEPSGGFFLPRRRPRQNCPTCTRQESPLSLSWTSALNVALPVAGADWPLTSASLVPASLFPFRAVSALPGFSVDLGALDQLCSSINPFSMIFAMGQLAVDLFQRQTFWSLELRPSQPDDSMDRRAAREPSPSAGSAKVVGRSLHLDYPCPRRWTKDGHPNLSCLTVERIDPGDLLWRRPRERLEASRSEAELVPRSRAPSES